MNYNKNINILAVSTIAILGSVSANLSASEKQIYEPRLENPDYIDQLIFFQQQQKQCEAIPILDDAKSQSDNEFKYIF